MSLSLDEKRKIHARYLDAYSVGREGTGAKGRAPEPAPDDGLGQSTPAEIQHHAAIINAIGVWHGAANVQPLTFDDLWALAQTYLIQAPPPPP